MGHGYEVLDVQGSCDNANLASGGLDKQVVYWDVITGKPVRRYRLHAGKLTFFLSLQTYKRLYSGQSVEFCYV